jgi:hypothetical protein
MNWGSYYQESIFASLLRGKWLRFVSELLLEKFKFGASLFSSSILSTLQMHFVCTFFFFVVLRLEFRAYTLSHSTSPFM